MKNSIPVILIILLILFLPRFGPGVHAANSQLVVRVTLSDGTPIAGVYVRVVDLSNNTLASEVTDESGQVIFQLPGNETYIVVASYGVWNESKTVILDEVVELISFVVRYGLPIGEYSLPLRLTIWTPGGFILTFEDADNITATVSTFNPRSKYNLNVKKNYVNFETNESGTYVINVLVTYRRLDWYSGSLITYSKTALIRTVQSFSFYSKKLSLVALVDTIIGPHYPTPEEVAKAQAKYLNKVKNDILKEIYKVTTETTINLRQFGSKLNETNTSLKNFAESVTKNMMDLSINLNSLFGNTWAGLLIIAVVTIFIGIIMISIYHGKEKEFVYPSEILKELKKLHERVSRLERVEARASVSRYYKLILIIIIVAALYLLYYYGLLDLQRLLWFFRR